MRIVTGSDGAVSASDFWDDLKSDWGKGSGKRKSQATARLPDSASVRSEPRLGACVAPGTDGRGLSVHLHSCYIF